MFWSHFALVSFTVFVAVNYPLSIALPSHLSLNTSAHAHFFCPEIFSKLYFYFEFDNELIYFFISVREYFGKIILRET